MTAPRLLDLFCCAGGAAVGYHRAGFEVVGVDVDPQPHYPFEFHQADALDVLRLLRAPSPEATVGPEEAGSLSWVRAEGAPFAAIHASPPCQHHSAAAEIHNSASQHPDLIPATRAGLAATGLPWVMENVERSTVRASLMLCGSMFDLGVKRHRVFECSHLMLAPACGSHARWYASCFGGRTVGRQRVVLDWQPGTRTQTWDKFDDEEAVGRAAMGIDWMSLSELSEAIPPAYTEWIGSQLLGLLAVAA